jgi:hypothetical protein
MKLNVTVFHVDIWYTLKVSHKLTLHLNGLVEGFFNGHLDLHKM